MAVGRVRRYLTRYYLDNAKTKTKTIVIKARTVVDAEAKITKVLGKDFKGIKRVRELKDINEI